VEVESWHVKVMAYYSLVQHLHASVRMLEKLLDSESDEKETFEIWKRVMSNDLKSCDLNPFWMKYVATKNKVSMKNSCYISYLLHEYARILESLPRPSLCKNIIIF